MSELMENVPKDFFEAVIDEVKAPYEEFKALELNVDYLEIFDTDPEDVIETKEKDAKAKKSQITKYRTSIQKLAKEKRDGFNKTAKEIIAIEKQFTGEIIQIENFLKDQMNYRKLRAEKMANDLHERRLAEIQPYAGHYAEIFFGCTTEDHWQSILNEAKLSKEAHIKAEEDRVAREVQERKERERLQEENLKLKKEREAKDREIESLKAGSSEEVKPEPIAVRGDEQVASGELKSLHDGISDLIAKAIAPVDSKELILFNNTIELLNKTKSYLGFHL